MPTRGTQGEEIDRTQLRFCLRVPAHLAQEQARVDHRTRKVRALRYGRLQRLQSFFIPPESFERFRQANPSLGEPIAQCQGRPERRFRIGHCSRLQVGESQVVLRSCRRGIQRNGLLLCGDRSGKPRRIVEYDTEAQVRVRKNRIYPNGVAVAALGLVERTGLFRGHAALYKALRIFHDGFSGRRGRVMQESPEKSADREHVPAHRQIGPFR